MAWILLTQVLRTFVLLFVGARCCSYFEIPVPNGKASNGTEYVIGRTMEFGDVLGWTKYTIATHARGEKEAKFGYLALEGMVRGLEEPYFTGDGMNEAGLTISALLLKESKYEAVVPSRPTDVQARVLVPEVLKNCATVDEVLNWLAQRRVVGPLFGEGLHWAITDPSGRSVVLEYLDGKRVVWENPVRVLTNDPRLDWHWRNLDMYVNLNPINPHQNDFLAMDTDVGKVPRPLSHGSNLLGLPGDGSPASRFVNLFYLRGYAIKANPPNTTDDATVLGNALLNRVFIPLGTYARDPGDGPEGWEYTPYGLLKMPWEKKMLVRGYKNSQWKLIDLAKLDFSKRFTWPVEDGTLGIDDITSKGFNSRAEVAV